MTGDHHTSERDYDPSKPQTTFCDSGRHLFDTLVGKKMTLEEAVAIALELCEDHSVEFEYKDMTSYSDEDTLTASQILEGDDLVLINIDSKYLYYTGVPFEGDSVEWYYDPGIWFPTKYDGAVEKLDAALAEAEDALKVFNGYALKDHSSVMLKRLRRTLASFTDEDVYALCPACGCQVGCASLKSMGQTENGPWESYVCLNPDCGIRFTLEYHYEKD